MDSVLRCRRCSLTGYVLVFCGRRGDIMKVLWFDGDGLCLLAKRLERDV
jgi:transposase